MNNKKLLKSKKGFTIVELVIVIAVIAILAAVLIPTFVGVTQKAKDSAALANAKNAYEEYVVSATLDDKEPETNVIIKSGDYYYVVTDGAIDTEHVETTEPDNIGDPIVTGDVAIYKAVTTPASEGNEGSGEDE